MKLSDSSLNLPTPIWRLPPFYMKNSIQGSLRSFVITASKQEKKQLKPYILPKRFREEFPVNTISGSCWSK